MPRPAARDGAFVVLAPPDRRRAVDLLATDFAFEDFEDFEDVASAVFLAGALVLFLATVTAVFGLAAFTAFLAV